MELLKVNGKMVVEDGGVMSNLTVEKLAEGVRIMPMENRRNRLRRKDFPVWKAG